MYSPAAEKRRRVLESLRQVNEVSFGQVTFSFQLRGRVHEVQVEWN